MILTHPVIDVDAKIDFYAGNLREFQRLKSIYLLLQQQGRQGVFYVSPAVSLIHEEDVPIIRFRRSKLDGFGPLVISSYKDLNDIFYAAEDRPFIYIEHEFSQDVKGLFNVVSLFLCMEDKSFIFRKPKYREVKKISSIAEAAFEIVSFVKGKSPKHITDIDGKSVGLIYMAFGEKAINAVKRSVSSLTRLGFSYPVLVVGNFPKGVSFPSYFSTEQWQGENPFDKTKQRNFQYRAGRIKPLLYKYSPFDLNLYLDADTRFIQPIHEGFSFLAKYDLAVTEEKLTLQQLYNKKLAGWEINLLERDITIDELGGNDQQKFINSGVFFFKKSKKTSALFEDWYCEWLRFQEWDEQLALMRSMNKHPKVKVLKLPVEWNDPFPNEKSYIFHNYGRGEVRMNIE